MTEGALALLVIPAFFLVFPLMWAGVILLLSGLSGWQGLAQRYRSPTGAPAQCQSFVSGGLGLVSYRNTLELSASPEHLYLGVFALFRVGHPWLAIPWSDVADAGQGQLLWVRLRRLELGPPGGPTVRLKLPEDAWQRCLKMKG